MLLSLGMLAFSGTASAEERDPAGAQAIFDQAMSLMKAGKYQEACPKLAESQRLDPGIGTQFHLATCLQAQGLLASAWAQFLEVESLASSSGQTTRERLASEKAAALEPKLGHIRIQVPGAARVEGMTIERDGMRVGDAQWDTDLPVDRGEHELLVKAEGYEPFKATVRVADGSITTFECPPLRKLSASGPSIAPSSLSGAAAKPVVAKGASVTPPLDGDTHGRSGGSKTLVWSLGILGVAGLGTGTALAVNAVSKNDASKKQCDTSNPNQCSAGGVDLRNDARHLGDIATVGFAVGGAALGGALILWLFDSGPSPEKAAFRPPTMTISGGLEASPGSGRLMIEGKF